ncbi:hypothetical protein MANES_17G038500v8 [Manihot esculenta]|uniref:Uncharacterized protein n=1 Tax=Manihot esculenta TaxID=3983 RepID=A0A2C9U4F5_MANES|nr:hypothetical protein MANES_17G038500v8 [Manihot esculenta]
MGECLKFGSLNAIEERQERLRKDRITGPKYSSVLKPLEKKLTRDWKARNFQELVQLRGAEAFWFFPIIMWKDDSGAGMTKCPESCFSFRRVRSSFSNSREFGYPRPSQL